MRIELTTYASRARCSAPSRMGFKFIRFSATYWVTAYNSKVDLRKLLRANVGFNYQGILHRSIHVGFVVYIQELFSER
jgi:hypothetical protein